MFLILAAMETDLLVAHQAGRAGKSADIFSKVDVADINWVELMTGVTNELLLLHENGLFPESWQYNLNEFWFR